MPVSDVQLDQRLYFSENCKSRLRGISAVLKAEVPVLPVLVLSERARLLLPDHCQVGFAVMFIITGFPFLCVKNEKSPCRVRA